MTTSLADEPKANASGFETPPTGLTSEQVKERIARGLTNEAKEQTSRSYGEILRANILTRRIVDRLSYRRVMTADSSTFARSARDFIRAVMEGATKLLHGLLPYGHMPGDVIQKVDNKTVKNGAEFETALQHHNPGDTVTLTIRRGGQTIQVPVKVVAATE